MRKNDIDISIVVPAKNEEYFLKSCLESIKKAIHNCNDSYEIIVVDNNSEDNTVEIAKGYNCKIVRHSKIEAGSSRNAGAAIAKGKYIAFIDADCILDEKWFQFTKEHFQHPKIVAVGTKICPNFDTATWVEETVFHLNNRRGVNLSEKTIKVRWIGTSNMLVRKEAFDKIGGFNEDLVTCEDYDLCTRLAEFGDIVLDKRIFTTHVRESKNLKELFNRELWRGQDCLKHWIKSGCKLYGAPSVLIPGIFLFCIITGLISLFLNFKISIIFLSLALTCSLLMVLRAKKTCLNPLLFLQSIVVSSSYLLGRGVALVKEFIIIAKTVSRKLT